jgi:hypothetical protein
MLFFVVGMVLLPVGLGLIIIGRSTGNRFVSLAGAGLTVALALIAGFGFVRWQWDFFQDLPSRREKSVFAALAVCGIAAGAFFEWLL